MKIKDERMYRRITLLSSLALTATSSFAAVTEQQVVEHYADLAHAVYEDSLITARVLETKINALVQSPSEQTLADAKQAWLDSRVPYQQSEVFRFGNPVVDDWEGQLNAWPLDEGLIDYVDANYQSELGNEGAVANIIANEQVQVGADTIDTQKITPELIASLNELGGSEANVASGYHAIEFLLWGQDLNGNRNGAGARQHTDYVVGDACTNNHCDRRGEYLQATAKLLISDLAWMEQQWADGVSNNYRSELLADSSTTGLRKMMFGMGSLSLGELAGERMKVALEANSTEDEHDCFSDNTHNSHYYNEQGIYNVYTGMYLRADGSLLTGPSIHDLVSQVSKEEAKEIQRQFDQTRAEVRQLVYSAEKNDTHFDQLIASNNAEGNQLVEDSISALIAQTAAIEKAAGVIGITSLNPDTADHEF
ncbi:peptidase [Vibrio breoganii]|nr:peptidase [Vibrio breoganii]PMO76337.1 peptidase [Vibrio breoganii]PMO89056.1 peptidase [Vibrio breoganii]